MEICRIELATLFADWQTTGQPCPRLVDLINEIVGRVVSRHGDRQHKEDTTQAFWVLLLTKYKQVDTANNVFNYLYTLALNKIRNEFRGRTEAKPFSCFASGFSPDFGTKPEYVSNTKSQPPPTMPTPQPKKKSLCQLAREAGIKRATLEGRLRYGWTLEEALTTPPQQNRQPLYQFRGQTLTVAQWSEVMGINAAVIRSRLQRGWPVERALTTPPFPSTRSITIRKQKIIVN